MSSQTPILTTNRYALTAKDALNLIWGQVLRRYWYMIFVVGGFVLYNVVKSMIYGQFPFNLLFPVVFGAIFLFARFRFLSTVKQRHANNPELTFTLYEDSIVSTNQAGDSGTFYFDEIVSMRSAKRGFALKLSNRNTLYVPAGGFKSEADRTLFEETLRKAIA